MASKYRNKKVKVDGILFDSIHEGSRYKELKLLERAGKIQNLRLQVKFQLIPAQRDAQGKYIRPVYYVADFVYSDSRGVVVEDAKGYKTDVYKLKKKLLLHVHHLEIVEV